MDLNPKLLCLFFFSIQNRYVIIRFKSKIIIILIYNFWYDRKRFTEID